MKLFIKTVLLLLLAYFTVLMVNITIPYLSLDNHTAFLKIKQWVIGNQIWKSAFYVHVISSCICLIAGFTQFSDRLLRSFPKLHRIIGRVYVGVILLLSGPSGFIMSLYANGGLISKSAFSILSVLWILFTYSGFYYVKKGDIKNHRKFMIRSFALTLSALTLRAWKFGIVFAFRPPPMDVYMIVAWLGWVPNFLFAEWYIRKTFKRDKHIEKSKLNPLKILL